MHPGQSIKFSDLRHSRFSSLARTKTGIKGGSSMAFTTGLLEEMIEETIVSNKKTFFGKLKIVFNGYNKKISKIY